MAKNVAINGFGRIGRLFFRAAWGNPDINIVSINDLFDPKYLAYSLKYDSVHKGWPGTVEAAEGALIVDGKRIPIKEVNPTAIPKYPSGTPSICDIKENAELSQLKKAEKSQNEPA